ncbi:PDZ/DHR/GLGF domain protein [Cooperia oncophora]
MVGIGLGLRKALQEGDPNEISRGQILENSPAEKCGRLKVGDRVVAVNGIDILNLSHGEIVNLIKASGLTVRLTIAPPVSDGSPLASSTLNRSVLPNAYMPSPPSTYVPPPPVFQNGGFYATLGRPSCESLLMALQESGVFDTYSESADMEAIESLTPSESPLLIPSSSFRRTFVATARSRVELTTIGVENDESDSPIISVELERGVRGFGFSIRGGQEFGAMPLFVLRIAEDGPAAIDGRLRVGDQLISINGRDTKGLTHEEAIPTDQATSDGSSHRSSP